MKAIFRKLRSNGGSSMVLALFLMLVAIMVSHTILAAAASAGQNVTQQTETIQAYLTVSSAAEAFRDSVMDGFKDPKFQREVRTHYSNDMSTVIETETSYTEHQGPFAAEMIAAMKHALDFGTAFTHSYTIQVDGYEDVSMVMTLAKDKDKGETNQYVLTAVFSNAIPGSPIPDAPYRMTVTIEATVDHKQYVMDQQGKWVRTTDTWTFTKASIQRTEEAAA